VLCEHYRGCTSHLYCGMILSERVEVVILIKVRISEVFVQNDAMRIECSGMQ